MLHLLRRFFGFLRAQPLSPSEQDVVRGCLRPPLRRLFFAQPRQDQRHAVEVMARVEGSDGAVLEAALLHDVGKTVSRIGAIERSLATVAGFLRLRTRGRWSTYLDHGGIGADLLEDAGAGALAIAFARFHPGPAPEGVDPESWELLARADEA